MISRILPLLALTACSAVDPAALYALRAVSPLEADPADIALSVSLPEGYVIRPGTVQLALTGESPDGEIAGTRVTLRKSGTAETAIYDVAPADHAALRVAQAEIADLKARDPETVGTLALSATLCTRGAPSDDRAAVSVRLEEDAPFLPLLRGAPVGRIAGSVPIGPCG